MPHRNWRGYESVKFKNPNLLAWRLNNFCSNIFVLYGPYLDSEISELRFQWGYLRFKLPFQGWHVVDGLPDKHGLIVQRSHEADNETLDR